MTSEVTRAFTMQGLARAFPAALATIGFLLTVTLTFQVFASERVIEGDLSTYLLPAKYVSEGWGTLYVDVFDLKPPLIFSLMVPWVALAGWSLAGFWLLYAVLLALLGAGFWLCLRLMLQPWWALAAFASACIVLVGFSLLEEILFTTEVLGLVLVVWAIWIGARARRWWPLLIAGLIAGLAGQVKEVFLLAPLALIPLAVVGRALGDRPRRLLAVVVGAAGAWGITLAILRAWGAVRVSCGHHDRPGTRRIRSIE